MKNEKIQYSLFFVILLSCCFISYVSCSAISVFSSKKNLVNEVQAKSKYTIKLEKNEIFDLENKFFADFFKEKCYSLKGKYQLVREINEGDLTIKTDPVILIFTKQIFELFLVNEDDSFKIFSQATENIKNIDLLIPSEKDLNCMGINIEEVTQSKLIKIYNLDICADTKQKSEELKKTFDEFDKTCVTQDPLLVEDFSYLNKLVRDNSDYEKEKKDIFDGVSYLNPPKQKSKKEIEKELLKGKVESIKNKLQEKKSSESELCRKKKLKAIDEKLDKEEEEALKKLKEKKYDPVDPAEINDENNKALKTLNNIEDKLESQIDTVKKKSEKLDSEKK